ncbi:MAG: hypothetical protein RLT05_24875 [Bauldia litoralis]
MRLPLAVSAIIGLSMAATIAQTGQALAAGPTGGTAYSTSQIQRLGPDALQRRLTGAKGVGLVQKLQVAARVRSFTESVYWYHKGESEQSLAALRARFDALHGQIADLVEGSNPTLHADLVRSRAALWQAFANPKLFRTGFGRDTIKRLEGRDPQLADSQTRR